jgi:ribulose-phosphate 3-epimerase
MKLAVSILSSNYSELETIKRINETNADLVHVDVMDGKFVKEKTPPYEYLHTSKKKLQVHLMVSSPFNYIAKYSVLNTESIIIPSEIEDDLNSLIDFIKSRGLKAGLAINPETSVNAINEYLPKLDEVLVMTVIPGKGGQKMMDSTLYKLDILDKLRSEKGYKFKIVVDGGVNDETIHKVSLADIVISGSFICKSEDYNAQIKKLNL